MAGTAGPLLRSRTSTALRAYAALVLRKAIFRRELPSRIIAVEGLLQLAIGTPQGAAGSGGPDPRLREKWRHISGLLRRAMGKKKASEMEKQKVFFLKGAGEKDVDPKQAEYIFDLMAKFAGYGFNKSHSVAYAMISYHTAYLKCHHPEEFMAAVLTCDQDNTDNLNKYIVVTLPGTHSPFFQQSTFFIRPNML